MKVTLTPVQIRVIRGGAICPQTTQNDAERTLRLSAGSA